MNRTSKMLSLASLAWLIPIFLAATLAGLSYALMTVLLGVAIIGGLAVAGVVASTGEGAPFSEDGDTPAGDTPEHSASAA